MKNRVLFIILIFLIEGCATGGNASVFDERTQYYHNIVKVFIQEGKYDKIIIELNKVIVINKNLFEALNDPGFIYVNKGEFDFTIILVFVPDDIQTLNLCGAAYASRDELKLAIIDWETVLLLDPNNINAIQNILKAKQIQGYEKNSL